MNSERLLFLFISIFFIVYSGVVKFFLIEKIKQSKVRTEENKKKEIKKGKFVSLFLLIVGIYWFFLFIFYKNLF